MSSSLLRLVTLDVTNTLIKVAGSPGRQYAYVARKHGVDLDENLLTGVFLKEYKRYNKKFPNFGAEHDMPAHEWWGMLVKDCFSFLQPSLDPDLLDKIANHLFSHYTEPTAWSFVPGALEAIKDLHRYPVKLGVVSNWDHRLYKVLTNLKIRSYFDFVLPSHVIGCAKPDERIFLRALEDAGCPPSEAVHFGDSLEKDFIGARSVGMGAYLLATKETNYDFLQQDFVVDSVQEFVNRIRPQLGKMKPELSIADDDD